VNPAELEAAVVSFREALRRAGLKVTPQRLEVFREAARSREHPDVETVYRGVRRRIPSISLDTVYRTLHLFLERGLIASLGAAGDRLRLDANAHPHHHFVCRRCGLTRDVESPVIGSLPVPAEASAWGRVERASVEFRGLCSACAVRVGDGRPESPIMKPKSKKNGPASHRRRADHS
jgi:Fur family peroxide stress response transcriptional regulator